MRWVRLTAQQAANIETLSATNRTNNFIDPVADASGAQWIGADVLTEPLFAHYAPALSTLTPTNETPVFESNE